MKIWRELDEFPGYEVSSDGSIRNCNSGRVLGIYDNGHGVLQVVMKRDGRPYARAVHRLMAVTFLDPPPSDDYVPIFINNDWTDLRIENLQWKPRWWAIKRTRQRNRTEPMDNRAICMLSTGQIFTNSRECALAIDGLEELIILTAQNRHGAKYMGSAFEFVY